MLDPPPLLPDPVRLRRFAERMPEVDPDSVTAIMTLRVVVGELDAALQVSLDRHGISIGRLRVLAVLLEQQEPMTHVELAAEVGVTKATMTGLIDGLERDGLVQRLPAPRDRRALLVRLMPTGRQRIGRVLPQHVSRLAELAAGLSGAEQRTLTRLLRKLRSHVVGSKSISPKERSTLAKERR